MKNLNYSLLLTLSSLTLLPSCHLTVSGRQSDPYIAVKASGMTVKKNISVSDFNAIDVSRAVHVILTDKPQGVVSVEVDQAYEKYLDVYVSGKTLHITTKKMKFNRGMNTIKVFVAGKGISDLNISSASHVETDEKLVFGDLNVDMSSASGFSGEVVCDKITAELSSASNMNISGTANLFTLDVSSASTVDAGNLIAKKVVCDVSSASTAEVYASEELNVEASSASRVRYGGDAKITHVETSSAASVSRK